MRRTIVAISLAAGLLGLGAPAQACELEKCGPTTAQVCAMAYPACDHPLGRCWNLGVAVVCL